MKSEARRVVSVTRREHTYRLRLGDAEHDDLEQRANDGGVAKADVIREAMGWEPEGLIRRDADTPRPRSGGKS